LTDAENYCFDFIRIDIHNVDAHALLGDIYRDQGRIEEARQWYQLAHDLDPDNLSIGEKLRETRSGGSKHAVSVSPSRKSTGSGSLGTQNLLGLSPTNWFRVIWVFSGLFIVAVVSVVLWMRAHPRTVAFVPTGTLQRVPADIPDAVRFLPNGQPRTPGNSVAGTINVPSPNTGAAGIQTPSARTPNAQVPNPAPGATSSIPPPSPASGASPPLVSVAAREEALVAQLSRRGLLPEEVTLAGVRVDARGLSVIVQLVQQAPSGVGEAEVRSSVARAGLLAAQAVFASDPAYSKVSLETRMATSGGQPQPFFEGDIDRVAAQRVDPVRDEERFSNTWWAPWRPADEAPRP
jgi:hypothetical protein